jgi:hypothetical protein
MNTDVTTALKFIIDNIYNYLLFIAIIFFVYVLLCGFVKTLSTEIIKIILTTRAPLDSKFFKDKDE